MFNKDTYVQRRQQLIADVKEGLIVLVGNEPSSMNYKDNEYHFRQDSSFLYFTGLQSPSLVLVIDTAANKTTLFGDNPSIDYIIWTGAVSSVEERAAKAGIEHVQPLSALQHVLSTAQQQKQTIHYLPPYRMDTTVYIAELLGIPYQSVKEKASLPLIKAIIKQRAVKSAEELVQIEEAVNTTAAMHAKAIQLGAPGVTEMYIAGIINGIAVSGGGNLSFPSIVTQNGQYLHNHASNAPLQAGKLLLCDAGAENRMCYAGDLTRTSPVDKTFTTKQKEIYQIVLDAQLAAIAALKPGTLFRDVHTIAAEKLVEGLIQIGLCKGDPKEAVKNDVHTLFFQCGLGHMMGLDVHDMENLGEQNVGYTDQLIKGTTFGWKSLRLGRALEEGFVVTIEPGLYFVPELMDNWYAEKKNEAFINYDKVFAYKDFGGIRIEDDFVITQNGSRLLGNPLPKTIAEIEAMKA
ncbi:Xaa-Pro aminopeptidase [Chitinophaga skermanii]|uniref:Xaa-Pro aminopeptidase n=1 Tax=Chitinophaga skermanii TaxID=331697 RepID=A0A327Q120_9BACT|nr:aminopeptidase P family protein [Chitinophaga skermanii]RAI97584.1 Xaa-Pro aminopeptidase [Chitinophaga skermanii]